MNSFPIINNNIFVEAFDRLTNLYAQAKIKILDAAERATRTEIHPFLKTANAIDPQLNIIRNKLTRTADDYGKKLFIKLIEELHSELSTAGVAGVSTREFIAFTSLDLGDGSQLKFLDNELWYISWNLDMEGYQRQVEFGVRGRNLAINDIVPSYILQYIQQAMHAFRQKRHAVSLALMTIALEGTLRDALAVKGYTYQYGAPSQDVYQIEAMHVHKNAAGYLVTFPSAMPLDHNHFLSAPGDPSFKPFRIKRVLKGNQTYLEIRQSNDLLDYWSSNTIVAPGIAQITGLGAAIDISRNRAAILSPIDLPVDFDGAIQAVRNNLIHLSGNAMVESVDTDGLGNPITLGDFLRNKNKVFDAVCTIGDAIDKIYSRIAEGTL